MSGKVTIVPPEAPTGLLRRWTGILTDSAKLADGSDPDPRMLRHGLLALAYARVTSFTGETVLRVKGAFPVSAIGSHGSAGSGLLVEGKKLDEATHIRIFETATKTAFKHSDADSLVDLAKALLPQDGATLRGARVDEPHEALMRVGPLIELKPLSPESQAKTGDHLSMPS